VTPSEPPSSSPTPTPAPTASPTPTPTPESFMCVSLDASKSTLRVGDKLSFGCEGSGSGISRYDFRYKIGDGDYQALAADTTNASRSAELTVNQAAKYTVQCRVCKVDNTCTTWGLAQ
jgi:hypothetical protein